VEQTTASGLEAVWGGGGIMSGGVVTYLLMRLMNRNGHSEQEIKVQGTDELLRKMDTLIENQTRANESLAEIKGSIARINGGR
jgi:hypothetical protein